MSSNVTFMDSTDSNMSKPLSKREVIDQYIGRLRQIDTARTELNDEKRVTKNHYVDNNLLTKEEIDAVHKLYTLINSNIDIDVYSEIYNLLLK